MEIIKQQTGNCLNVAIKGKLDTNTSTQLRRDVAESLDGITELIFDLGEMEYISSAGLRVLLACQQTMDVQGSMSAKNVRPEIMRIFKATGFLNVLKIV